MRKVRALIDDHADFARRQPTRQLFYHLAKQSTRWSVGKVILRDHVTFEGSEERGTLPHAGTNGGIGASAANLKLKKWTNKPDEARDSGMKWPSLRG